RGAAKAWEELEETVIGILGPRWRREAPLLEPALDAVPRKRTPSRPVTAGRTRRRHVAAAVLVAAAGAGGAPAAVELPGGSGAAADALPSPSEQPALAVAGPGLYVTDPRGRIVALSASSLRLKGSFPDPQHPRAVGSSPGRVYVVDDAGVRTFRGRALAPD